ncbi:MAG: NapC/NirT family cytochrome c [Desulfobulbus sp.]|jgi:cytochrome c-type protein NapC|uniref:cytochrome c3 family protein n=1 Tax=Desulfobulbus sp. TaxID=895 RepID=UPI002850A9D2|nr:NapC/NirT family cytochrome c [Desulfobulbus sp.]MDR2550930.1 NapC/NirT family cytochrome c [Desulfobulbus sp.]
MKKTLLFLLAGTLVGIGLALGGAEMIERTSGVEFCSSCHSMRPMARAYEEDIHGGRNRFGVKARCVDCHLPHDNVLDYVVAKAYSGTKDVLGELFWVKTFDWVGNLQHRERFTYSSGCRQCHDLNAIRYQIPKAFLAHRDYKMGIVASCVHCHRHVGHKDITGYLTQQQP